MRGPNPPAERPTPTDPRGGQDSPPVLCVCTCVTDCLTRARTAAAPSRTSPPLADPLPSAPMAASTPPAPPMSFHPAAACIVAPSSAGAAPVLLVPGFMPHSQQYPWLYDAKKRFRAPCVLHEQLHGCAKELRRITGNHFWPPGQVHTRAHEACIRAVQRQTPTVAVAPAAAQQSNARAVGSRAIKRPLRLCDSDDSNADTPSTRPLRLATPLGESVQSLTAAKSVWQQKDYATLRGLDGAAELARRVAALPANVPTRLLAGATLQQALAETDDWTALRGDIESLCRRACDAVGFVHSGLQFIEPKRLVSLPGEGEQAVHWDCAFAYDTLPNTITFLLHCTEGDGIDTTALPLYSARERIPATQPRDAVAFGSEHMYIKTSRRRQLQSAIPLLDKQHFHRVSARVGDVTLCRQSVPHYGTRNNSGGERVVLFDMFSSSDLLTQDDFQFFRWQFVGEAFGRESLEYAQALVAGKEFESVERFREADEQSWREANQLLEKFDLLRLYYGEEGQPQWNNEQEQATTERADKKEKRRGAASAAAAAVSVSASTSAAACVSVADANRE